MYDIKQLGSRGGWFVRYTKSSNNSCTLVGPFPTEEEALKRLYILSNWKNLPKKELHR